jgi:hypothetical protein
MVFGPIELHTPGHANGSRLPFPRTVLNRSKPPKYPERGRGFTVKPLPSFLTSSTGTAFQSGFGWAASASRKTLALLLSTTTVPVSTQAGMAGAGAVRQSLNSCTAL